MEQRAPQPRVFALWAEAPLAYTCVALAAAALVWKTVGLDVLPGWEEMFGGPGAQYPRSEPLTSAWSLAYLLVYGVLGVVSTFAGVLLTRRRSSLTRAAGPQIANYARVVGAFHTVIGLHHTLWAVTAGAWGHLTLEQFYVPGLYLVGGVAGLGAGLHGLRLLFSSSTDPTYRIVRSKIAVDGVSVLTFISIFVCFPMNLLGIERSLEIERVSWIAVFVCPVLWLLAELIVSRVPSRRAPAT